MHDLDGEGDGTELDADARADLEALARAAGAATYGLDVGDLGMSDRAALVERLALGDGTVKELRRVLGDRDRVRALLDPLPPASLWVVELLAEAGGRLTDAAVTAIVASRTGWSERDVWNAVLVLAKAGLVAVVERPYDRRRLLMLLEPSTKPLLELLGGASIPDAELGDVRLADPATGPGRGWRDVVAIAAHTAQRRIRATQDGRPDRGSVKAAAKGLGLPIEAFSELLDRAITAGLLERAGDRFVPLLNALARAARGEVDPRRLDPDEPAAILRRWLPVREWVTLEAAARALWRALGARRGWLTGPTWTDPARELERIRRALSESDELEHGIAPPGDAPVVRRRTAAAPSGSGDGHVTPSYEVLIGPGADLEVLVPIALGCELRKIDHVLTYRLGRETVAAGIAAGLEPADLRAALGRVGPHGLPDNVAATLDDWVAGVHTAALEHGLFLFGEPDLLAALADGPLAEHVVDRPVPGAMEIEPATPEGLLAEEAARVGLTLPARAASVLHRARRATSHDWVSVTAHASCLTEDRWAATDSPLALRPAPDSELRARLRAATPPPAQAAPPPPSVLFRDLVGMILDRAARDPEGKTLRALARLISDAAPQLVVWMKRLTPEARAEATELITSRFAELVPVLILTPVARGPVIARADSISALLETAKIVATDPAHRSSRGQAFLALSRPAPEPAPVAGVRDVSRTVLDPNTIGEVLGAAIRSGSAVRVGLSGGDARSLVPERILRRGPKHVVVGIDTDRNEGAVIPLDTIVAIDLGE